MSHGFKMIVNAFGIVGALYLGCLTGYIVYKIKRKIHKRQRAVFLIINL